MFLSSIGKHVFQTYNLSPFTVSILLLQVLAILEVVHSWFWLWQEQIFTFARRVSNYHYGNVWTSTAGFPVIHSQGDTVLSQSSTELLNHPPLTFKYFYFFSFLLLWSLLCSLRAYGPSLLPDLLSVSLLPNPFSSSHLLFPIFQLPSL